MKWDDRYLYVVLLIAMAGPTLFPIGLEFLGTEYVLDFYEALDSVPNGSKILIISHLNAANWPTDYKPGTIAFTYHIISKNLRPVIVCTWADAPLIWHKEIRQLFDDAGYVYGTDWLLTGFYPGMEAAVGAFTDNPRGVVLEDFYGNPGSSLPLLQEIETMDDFALGIMQWSASADLVIRQTYISHDMRVLLQPNTGELADALTYWTAGMAEGVMTGIRGGAEYEMYIGRPGEGSSLTDALSIIMIVVPGATILGNIVHFAKKIRGDK